MATLFPACYIPMILLVMFGQPKEEVSYRTGHVRPNAKEIARLTTADQDLGATILLQVAYNGSVLSEHQTK